ncbi:CRISPR-associated endonuclease Cas2 [Desulfurobacterium atlanticum]|uniref:CRISPR-associated endoribonuclease Cas2 n=1 Tax=Desulfurobacterium atlanticum TaxID=240169 RepID=A0A238XQR0_9BACT|nr:CRISPR-associated endonuclease Cas2 [Desulfurobacterium atlanticum]SNR60319.1 CRISPR-associated protein, Cas2 family [Desulfurobacterium atlanticum]
MFYVITYDISDDKIRNKLMKLLKNYGRRVQFSCFEVDLTEKELETLKEKIESLIDSSTDKVYIFPVSNYVINDIVKLGIKEKQNESYIL